jgi:23S rRNA pseudouridine1911/1915/1917 synthase
LEVRIESELKPLLHWVLLHYPETPRTRAKQWIVIGRVSVAGEVLRRPHQLMPNPGDQLELRERSALSMESGTGWQIHSKVALLYLDASFAIINKGAGLISVPAPNSGASALSILADFLAGRLKAHGRAAMGGALPAAYRKLQPLPVHRLDQYTSGALCIATNPKAREKLIEQLRAHTMKREYVAFVQGRPVAPKGTWRAWLQPSDNGLTQHVVSGSRRLRGGAETREAITHFEVIETYRRGGETVACKLRVTIETGLKHQIRVQAAHAGVPVIGDRSYNPVYQPRAPAEPTFPFSRQALHAERLTLQHPERAGQVISCVAPWPRDLLRLEANLKAL